MKETHGLRQLDLGRWLNDRHRRSRNLSEVPLDPFLRLIDVDIPCDHECRIVRTVPLTVEVDDVGEFGTFQIRQRTDDLPPIGVSFGVERAIDHVVVVAVRLVVDALPLLVLHDLLLLRHHGLGHGVDEEAELVRLRPQRLLEAVRGHDFEVVRAVVAGRTVRRASDTRHQAIESARPEILGVEKEEVLEQVREPRLSLDLSRGTHVERHRDGRNGIGAVHMENDVEPVGQLIPLEVDRHPLLTVWGVRSGATSQHEHRQCRYEPEATHRLHREVHLT